MLGWVGISLAGDGMKTLVGLGHRAALARFRSAVAIRKICAASPGPDAEYHGAFLVRLLFFGHKPGHNPTAPALIWDCAQLWPNLFKIQLQA